MFIEGCGDANKLHHSPLLRTNQSLLILCPSFGPVCGRRSLIEVACPCLSTCESICIPEIPAIVRLTNGMYIECRALDPYKVENKKFAEDMSGFITTMFVSLHPTSFQGPLPAQPKPLRPILAQSKSCTQLGIHAVERDDSVAGRAVYMGRPFGRYGPSAPRIPQLAYKSPLQRRGEALRTSQAGAKGTPRGSDDLNGIGQGHRSASSPMPVPKSSCHLARGEESPTRDTPNYSYKLLPGGNGSPKPENVRRDWDGCSGRGYFEPRGNGTPGTSSPRSRLRAPRNYGQSTDTCLRSFNSSNPRTRAPFKPQKAGRGTSSWQLKQYAEATLGSGSLRKAVKLPEGEDRDEWLAVNGEK